MSEVTPRDREEKLLAAIAEGATGELPTPRNRKEKLLKEIYNNGGTGGGGGESTIAWRPTVDANGNISWERTVSTVKPATQNIRGPKGVDGRSAYEIAVESGYVGTEQAFYECLANLPILYNILNYTEADNGKVLGIEDGQIKWVNNSASSETEPDKPATEPTKGYIALTFDDGYAGQYGEQMMSVLNDKSLPFGRAIFTNSAYQGESNSAYYSVKTYKGMHDTLGTEIFTHAPTVNAGFINGTGSTALSSGWLKTWLNTTAYGVTSNNNKDTLLEILEPSIAVVPYKTGFAVSDLTEEMLADLSTDRSYKTIITGTRYQIWSVPTVYLNIVNPIDSTSSYDLGASEYTDSVCYNRVLADDVTEDFIKGLSGKGAFICIHDQHESNVASLNNILSWCESNNVEVISNTELVNKLKKQTE